MATADLLAVACADDPDGYFVRADIESYLQHSVEPLRAALRDHGTLLDPAGRNWIEHEIARTEGGYLDAMRLLEAIPTRDPLARGTRIGSLYLAAGDTRRAEESFRGAEVYALTMLKREPGRLGQVDFMVKLAAIQSMLGKHATALATIETARTKYPEARDAVSGPMVSFTRSIILVRSGRSEEGYAGVARLLRVPFGSPSARFLNPDPVPLLVKDDPHYDELINRPPRL